MLEMFTVSKWVWVDYTIASLIAISTLIGLFRGFIKEALGLAIWLFAVWIGMEYSQDFSALFGKSSFYPPAQQAIAFIGLFFLTLMFGRLISYLLNRLMENTGLSFSDRLVGMGFGLMRGGLLVCIMVMLAGMTAMPKDPWWAESQFIPPFQSLAVWLKDFIPPNLASHIKYR